MRSSSVWGLMMAVVVEGARDLRLTVDLHLPGLGPKPAGLCRRIRLVGAELVEVVVAGDLVELVRRILGAQGTGADARQAPVPRRNAVVCRHGRDDSRVLAPTKAGRVQQRAAVEEHTLRRDFGGSYVRWFPDQHGRASQSVNWQGYGGWTPGVPFPYSQSGLPR